MSCSSERICDLVSIITPVHNASEYLEETIDSVLNQTYKNLEIILIDDASTDLSREIINKYQGIDNRVKSILLDENVGVANARNQGIRFAKGKYIAFLDSDDIWLKDKLDTQIKFMKNNNIAFSHTSYQFIDEDGNKIGNSIKVDECTDYTNLLRINSIGCLTVVIDIEKVGLFEMPNIRHEDYATWLTILKRGYNAYGINESLALYRKSATSLSGNKIKSAMWTWNIIRNVEQVPFHKALLYFGNYTVKNLSKHYLKK